MSTFPTTSASRPGSHGGQRGQRLLRSDAGQADRHGARPRDAAVAAMQAALDQTRIDGIETNLRWLRDVVRTTGLRHRRGLDPGAGRASSITPREHPRHLAAAPATTVQDYPGRIGYWASACRRRGRWTTCRFRLGNRLLGNAEGAAGLEITATGPTLLLQHRRAHLPDRRRFRRDARWRAGRRATAPIACRGGPDAERSAGCAAAGLRGYLAGRRRARRSAPISAAAAPSPRRVRRPCGAAAARRRRAAPRPVAASARR